MSLKKTKTASFKAVRYWNCDINILSNNFQSLEFYPCLHNIFSIAIKTVLSLLRESDQELPDEMMSYEAADDVPAEREADSVSTAKTMVCTCTVRQFFFTDDFESQGVFMITMGC